MSLQSRTKVNRPTGSHSHLSVQYFLDTPKTHRIYRFQIALGRGVDLMVLPWAAGHGPLDLGPLYSSSYYAANRENCCWKG